MGHVLKLLVTLYFDFLTSKVDCFQVFPEDKKKNGKNSKIKKGCLRRHLRFTNEIFQTLSRIRIKSTNAFRK